MTNFNQVVATEARGKIFASLILRDGILKRGIVVSRMHVSEHTFAGEYKGWLEQYPTIKYNPKTREFTYEP